MAACLRGEVCAGCRAGGGRGRAEHMPPALRGSPSRARWAAAGRRRVASPQKPSNTTGCMGGCGIARDSGKIRGQIPRIPSNTTRSASACGIARNLGSARLEPGFSPTVQARFPFAAKFWAGRCAQIASNTTASPPGRGIAREFCAERPRFTENSSDTAAPCKIRGIARVFRAA